MIRAFTLLLAGGPIEIDTALLYSPRSSAGMSSALPSPANAAPPRSSWRHQGERHLSSLACLPWRINVVHSHDCRALGSPCHV